MAQGFQTDAFQTDAFQLDAPVPFGLDHPVQARQSPARAGRVASRDGTYTAPVPQPVKVNIAEGGTAGVGATPGNSGGASGTAWTRVVPGTGTAVFNSGWSAHGALSYLITPDPAGGSADYVGEDLLAGSQSVAVRLYAMLDSLPSAATQLLRVLAGSDAGAAVGNLFVNTNGSWGVQDSTGTTLFTAPGGSLVAGNAYRFELYAKMGVGNGEYRGAAYVGDSTTPAQDSGLLTLRNGGAGTIGAFRLGKVGASGTWAGFHVDDVAWSEDATGLLGPVVTAAGPPAKAGPVRSQPVPVRSGRVSTRAGAFTATAPQSGPPVYPLDRPVQARQQPVRTGSVESRAGLFAGVGPALRALAGAVSSRLRVLPPRGRTAGRTGVFGGTGPPVEPTRGPVAATRVAPPRGRVASRVGTFTPLAPTTGPPLYPLGRPVQARRLPQRAGDVTRTAGVYGGTGPALRSADGPVRAQPAPVRGGRVVARVGTLTAGAPQAGPPVYPTGRPAAARRLPVRGGTVSRRTGPSAGTGPPAPQLRQPVGRGRQQPPPPARGRTASLRGLRQGTGPPLRPLQRPVRSRLPGPVLTGRARTTLLPAVAVPPPAFSVGQLTGSSTTSVLTAATSTSTLAAASSSTSPSSASQPTSVTGTSSTSGPT